MSDSPNLDEIPVALYRFFDADNELLYVGITINPSARFAKHRAVAAWWSAADHKTITWFDTREDAVKAELAAIRSESPRYNLAGTKAFNGGGGRPVTVLTDQQRAALADLALKADAARDAEALMWQAALDARAAGVPDVLLCEESGLSRATLNRKFGPRRELLASR